jgi:hypothetical protein
MGDTFSGKTGWKLTGNYELWGIHSKLVLLLPSVFKVSLEVNIFAKVIFESH